jgi:hypothetical protein
LRPKMPRGSTARSKDDAQLSIGLWAEGFVTMYTAAAVC